MFGAFAKKLFGSSNDRRLKTYFPSVERINALEKDLEGLSDEALAARTRAFRDELAAGKTLDDILVEAFATVREAAKRTLGQRHFDDMIGVIGPFARPIAKRRSKTVNGNVGALHTL